MQKKVLAWDIHQFEVVLVHLIKWTDFLPGDHIRSDIFIDNPQLQTSHQKNYLRNDLTGISFSGCNSHCWTLLENI